MAIVVSTAPRATPTTFTDRTASIDRTSLRITMRADGGIGSCSAVFNGAEPSVEDVVRVAIDGTVVFKGRVVGRARAIRGSVSTIAQRSLRITAADSNRLLDKSIYHAIGPTGDLTSTDAGLVIDVMHNGNEQTREVTYGGFIRSYSGSAIAVPASEFYLKTKRAGLQALRRLLRDNAVIPFFYVDVNDELHWARSESDVRTLPWNFSDNPDGSTSFGYWDFEMADDTNGLVNHYVRSDAGTITHYTLSPADPSSYGRFEAVHDEQEVWELSSTAFPVTSGRLTTFKRVLAGDYVQVFNTAWGNSLGQLLDVHGITPVGLMRIPVVSINFDQELRPVYEVTLVSAAPSLAGYL